MTIKKLFTIIELSLILPLTAFANTEIIEAVDNIFNSQSENELETAAHALSAKIIEQDIQGITAQQAFEFSKQHIASKIENDEVTPEQVSQALAKSYQPNQ